MESERLEGAESLFRNGYLSVREFVSTGGMSAQYRTRFLENCDCYRFIELNHKHVIGGALQTRLELFQGPGRAPVSLDDAAGPRCSGLPEG